MAEIYIYTSHKKIENYERGLNLNEAVAYTRYTADGVHYDREFFMFYPDNVLGIRVKADAPFSCRVEW